MKRAIKTVLSSIIIILPFLMSSCVAGTSSSGGLQRRLEVEKLFDSGTLLSNHSYYSEGPSSEPNAIIAISNEFQLQSNLWSKMEWNAKELAATVRWMRIGEFGLCRTDGGVLLAPDGTEIGIWFSKRNNSIVRQPAPGVVEVYPFVYVGSTPCARRDRSDMF